MEITPEYKINLARELRQRQTASEAALWQQLRGRRLAGLKFRRQHPIGRFVADFCCEQAMLVVEVDGGYHDDPTQRAVDAERAAHLIGRGYAIFRIPVAEVEADIHNVLTRIRLTAARAVKTPATGTPLPEPGRGEGGEGRR